MIEKNIGFKLTKSEREKQREEFNEGYFIYDIKTGSLYFESMDENSNKYRMPLNVVLEALPEEFSYKSDKPYVLKSKLENKCSVGLLNPYKIV